MKELIIQCYNCLGRKIDRLKGQLIEIKSEIEKLKAIPKTSRVEDLININLNHDEEIDGFTLPCKTLAALRAFDVKLKEDGEYRKKIVSFIFVII